MSAEGTKQGREEPGLARRTGRGVLWMVLATLVGKLGSFGSQIVLGWLLLKEDFGIYSIALGVTTLVQVLRDGGVRQVLVQRGTHRYEKLSGPAFWFGFAISLVAGAALIAGSPIAGMVYGEPELVPLLIVMGLSVLFQSPPAVFRAKMALELRFDQLSVFQVVSAFARYGSLVGFAWAGFGAMAFAWSMVAAAVAECLFGFIATRDQPWLRPPRFRMWRAILGQSQWLILGTFALSNLRQGSYIVLGFFETTVVLGVYFFAYQLAVQINVLIATNLQQVLFPALTRLKNAPARHREATLRAARVMVLIGGGFALALAVTIDPLEFLIWRFKWHDAVLAVQIMAIFFPLRLLLSVLNSGMMSKGANKSWAMLTLVQGAGLLVIAAIAGILFDEAWQFALVVGCYFATGVFATVLWGLKSVGVPAWSLTKGVVPVWLIAVMSGLMVLTADAWLVAEGVVPQDDPVASLLRAGFSAGVFGLVYAVALRVLVPTAFAEAVDVAPGRLKRPLRRAFRIPKPKPIDPRADMTGDGRVGPASIAEGGSDG